RKRPRRNEGEGSSAGVGVLLRCARSDGCDGEHGVDGGGQVERGAVPQRLAGGGADAGAVVVVGQVAGVAAAGARDGGDGLAVGAAEDQRAAVGFVAVAALVDESGGMAT